MGLQNNNSNKNKNNSENISNEKKRTWQQHDSEGKKALPRSKM